MTNNRFTFFPKGGLDTLQGTFEARGIPIALPPTPFGRIKIMFDEHLKGVGEAEGAAGG
jgi:hypothetical protein